MDKPAHANVSLTHKVTFFASMIGAIILLGNIFLVFFLSKIEYLGEIEERMDSFSRAVAPTLIQNLDSNDHDKLDVLMEMLLDNEDFSEIALTLNTGSTVSTRKFLPQKKYLGAHGANRKTMTYSYPYAAGIAQMKIVMQVPWFSSTTFRKIATYAFLVTLSLAALSISLIFFLKNHIFSRIHHIAEYLNSLDSDSATFGDGKSSANNIDDVEQIVKSIQDMRNKLSSDIKERERIEIALREEKEEKIETRRLIREAKAANKAKSEFIATMSHEIRTPLNGVVGMVEMLKDTPLNTNQKHYLDVLYRSGESLLEIINDILDYSKIESGRMLLEKISFDLEELIENCTKLFGATANKRNIEMISNIAPGTPRYLVGDPTRLRQILINLVGNAFKFTTEGYIIINVNTETNATDQNIKLLFSVVDSGIGISQEHQSHLFDAFQQADSSTTRKFGGSGLGLTICKQLAELMGGEIGIESEQNDGSTFWFTAHFFEDHATNAENPESSSLGLSKKRLLMVNLSQPLIKGIRQHAPHWNLYIDSIEGNGLSVLDKLKAQKKLFDFVMIDDKTDENTGFDIAQALKEIEKYSNSSILILSKQHASSFSQSQLQAVSAIIPRPIAIEKLKHILISHCLGTQLNPLMTTSSKTIDHCDLNVLVAEDNAVNRMVIEGLLGKLEITPDFAENGREAIDIFFNPQKKYDLILMDCEMPELDGFDATTKIREEEKNRAISATPIIALTAHVEASHRQRVFDCGMNHFLSKPVTIKKLNEALATVGLGNF